MQIFLLLKEFLADIKKQKLRAFLTTVAITWGTLAVILLMAFGTGLGFRMQESFLNAGDKVIRLYSGQTSKEYQGLPTGRRIPLSEEDAWLLQKSIPDIDIIHPGFGRGVHLRKGDNAAWTHMEGVFPQFEILRRTYPAAGGRFINETDIKERRRVVFLGGEIAKELCGYENPIGEIVLLDGLPFTIIGTMPKKLQTAMNNGPDDRRAIIPFTTFRALHGYRYVSEILVHVRNPNETKRVITQIREILGRKYQFDPTDERAIFIWDMIEAEKISRKVFLGLNIFLGVIGGMTLVIAGIGVANIMYVVAKERTREIGIKRAVGAKRRHIIFQFVFESLLIAVIGGSVGLLISVGIVKLMWMVPISDEGAMQFLGRPLLSPAVIITSITILTTIGLLAGLFPARKAANVDPVEALRYE
ncbi:ABC transporter permease [candidate division KSB1 bacterium]|nr:ABC transporter permease [candidate division KSB1 bacterium]RQW01951.1 MAG: ABC transporter permease [candidate division KSB1 bacterium]